MVRATTWMSRLSFLFMAGCLLTLASPAGAATYVKFYDGGTGYNGPFNGANTVYANTAGSTTDCPDGHAGCGAGDVVDTSLTFLGGTITATATTGATATKAWDDTSPDWGGLGAGPRRAQRCRPDCFWCLRCPDAHFQHTSCIVRCRDTFC